MQAVVALFLAAVSTLPPVDVPFKLRGYFLAVSRPRRIDRALPRGRVALIARPGERVSFDGHRGFRVLLANTTRAEVSFEASDYRLNITREALDPQGRWRAVEYLPQSWCGNSYHHLELPPDKYWSFAAPEYRGTFKTRMRFVLEQAGLRVVSNEIEGSVNLDQFTRIEGHTPHSIMDPYRE